MKTEKEKMLSGELYDASDKVLKEERIYARDLTKAYNSSSEKEQELRNSILAKLIPLQGDRLEIQPPFYCDYGYNIMLGDGVYFNFNCVLLDVMPIKIGARTLIGPNVQIYTATHPINFKERASGLESGKAIEIGEDVWLGGSVVINPGVNIGDRSVIGAGSVVTKDIPNDVFAAGNPCKMIRSLV